MGGVLSRSCGNWKRPLHFSHSPLGLSLTLLGGWAEVTGPPRLAGVSARAQQGTFCARRSISSAQGTEGTPAPIPFLGRRPRLLPPHELSSECRERAMGQEHRGSFLSPFVWFSHAGSRSPAQHTASLSPEAATVLTGTRAQRLLGNGGHTAVRVGVLGCFSRRVRHSQPAKSTSSPSERLMKAWF